MDYSKLGLKIGLEIHQRLETHKLFCKCPSVLRDDKPDIIFKRKMRAVSGENEEIDTAAKHEMAKGQEYIYEAYSDTTCLVEMDEEPPGELNIDALEITLQVAKLLNAKIVEDVIFMRKTVIDGSNTSGFQRTALIARDGYIETSRGKVRIGYIYLEEEAAKNIKEAKSERVWRLDRLGIPLIEIQTFPDIKDGEHAKETAEKLGMILRSTGRAKHGIGSIRQDINLSITKGARVEIKGFQDLRSIPKVIDNEIKRQLELVKKGRKINKEVRKANADGTTSFMRPMPGSARMYPETDVKIILITKKMLDKIKIPELLSEKALKLEKKFGLNAEIAREIVKKNLDFEDYVKEFKNINPVLLASFLIEKPKEIKKRFMIKKKVSEKDLRKVLSYLNKGEIAKEAIVEILVKKLKGEKFDIKDYKSSVGDLEKDIKKIIKENKGASINALMGEVMARYRGKVDGKKVMEILKKHL
jgi:Glu-tRNA(Gln) amidotransferase subunit E-like FAD-binding protein